jgi:eukaryotic-like serine/threonine-protein kinase
LPWVTLFDLGLAHVAGKARITQPGIVHGTAHYMAPEQALGEGLDARTDLYAVGVVLYELVNGQVPFPGKSYAKVLQGHLSSRPPAMDVGQAGQQDVHLVEPIVMRCLEKRPEGRFQSAEELGRALIAASAALSSRGTAPKLA